MENKEIILNNLHKVHTTQMGIQRIKKNLSITGDVVQYCKELIQNKKSSVIKTGKNYYVTLENVILTINSYSYTIITAKRVKLPKDK